MTRLGRYEIVSEIGRGGMGIVYRAVDTALGRSVAIKTISLSGQGTPEEAQKLRERLMREAQAAATLSHPNVVAVYDVGQEGDTAYVVMELVRGETLERTSQVDATRGSEALLKVLEDIARALDYAHAHGVVHRDVKPGNIFVEENGGVKLGDFGIAKVTWSHTMTETGAITGSPHYMAPEQLRGERVTGRTDQFALAAVAYTLLTGRKPFDADTFASLASKILFEEAPSPEAFGVQLPAEVEKVLRKAMSKDPAGRFVNCTEFTGSLRDAFHVAAPAPQPPQAEPPPGRWVMPAALAATAIVVVALALFVWLRQQRVAGAEVAYWESIQASREATAFEDYLKRYPRGRFVSEAQTRLETIRKAAAEGAAGTTEKAVATAKGAAKEASPPASPTAKTEVAAVKPAVAGLLKALGQRVNPQDGMVYIHVPPGSFRMGCFSDDPCDCCSRPSHSVTITKGFWIGQTAVTVEAYRRYSQESGREMPPAPTGWGNCFKDGNLRNPVCNVTWKEANDFCRNVGGRLPTEAEWEYAARAGWSATARSSAGLPAFYTKLDEVAWLDHPPHPVAQKAPNALGLFDTLGLMSEWCQDFFSHQYPETALTDPVSQTDKSDDYPAHVLRGGHTEDMARMPFNTLVSLRERGVTGEGIETTRFPGYGFRCVLPEP